MSGNDEKSAPVTHGLLEATMKALGERMSALLRTRLAPISQRLAAAETRVGALSMLLAKGDDRAKLAGLEEVLSRIDALEREVAELRRK